MPAEMAERVDWSKRAEYIKHRHNVETAWADEAVADPDAVWLDPDPVSASGLFGAGCRLLALRPCGAQRGPPPSWGRPWRPPPWGVVGG